ncbi:hypothetical protein BDV12DRAFT_192601 [Aspergillus spectabilis]
MRLSIKTALLLAASLAQAHPHPHAEPKALYVMRNTAENVVIGIPITANGMLAKGHATLTGGRGGNAPNGPNQPSGPDALFSQAPLTVAGEFIFAVNPGTNTLSVLKAHRANPAILTVLAEPVPIPGEFPSTVAASVTNHLVCVGTTGAQAGISCTSFTEDDGLGPFDTLRPYLLNQTTPPTGPPNTGVPGTNNTGFLSVFPVIRDGCRSNGSGSRATLGRHDTRSSFTSAPLLFGAAAIPSSNRIVVTDPTFGAAVLDVNPNTNKAALISQTTIPGQQAKCWASYSPVGNSVIVTDANVNNLVELDAKDCAIVSIIDLPNQDPGYIDLKAAGGFVYALSPGNGTTEAAVVVFDVEEQKQIQHVGIGAFGADRNAVGVVVLEL